LVFFQFFDFDFRQKKKISISQDFQPKKKNFGEKLAPKDPLF